MATRICIASQKGGVGKTTVALNLAVALAELGRSVLLVDLDPQGGIGLSLAREEGAFSGMTELMAGRHASEALVPTKLPGLTLLPRGRLDPVDIPLYEETLFARDGLAKLLAAVPDSFDRVLLDTPAGLGMPTRAALAGSGFVLVVQQAEPLALRSLGQALRVVDHVRQTQNAALRLLGILPTMTDLRAAPSRSVMDELWSGFSGVLETTIPRSAVFAAASDRGLPVAFLGGTAPAPEAQRFATLAGEVETLLSRMGGSDAEAGRPEREIL